jgi:hypothetical protein
MFLDIKGVCQLVREISPTFCDGPGRGIHLFVSTGSVDDLRKCTLAIAESIDASRPMEVYVVHGDGRGENGWPFSRVRAGSRMHLKRDGSLILENSLIFPQLKPIVLLIESFGYLDHFDQRAYSHLVDGEGGDVALCRGSILISGVTGGDEEDIETGSLDRGFYIELRSGSGVQEPTRKDKLGLS